MTFTGQPVVQVVCTEGLVLVNNMFVEKILLI